MCRQNIPGDVKDNYATIKLWKLEIMVMQGIAMPADIVYHQRAKRFIR